MEDLDINQLNQMTKDELVTFATKQAKQAYRYRGRFSEVIRSKQSPCTARYNKMEWLDDGVIQDITKGEGEV